MSDGTSPSARSLASKARRWRSALGCWMHERWRAELVLAAPAIAARVGVEWTDLRNRGERLARGEGEARECLWQYSSLLTVARDYPGVGGRLLRHCLREWPLRLAEDGTARDAAPRLSVVLPVGGSGRAAQFRAVLASVLGQSCGAVEIIVVEQGEKARYRELCPEGVRHHLRVAPDDAPFNKSALLNLGVAMASAPYLLLHDADVVMPAGYVESVVDRLDAGWESVRPIRFTFHLTREASERLQATHGAALPASVDAVQSNNPGLSTGLTREAYLRIGGHDERFEGWGGEDWDFLERLRTTRLYRGGYAPTIHLWHPPAPNKVAGDRNLALVERLRAVDPAMRIRQLRERTTTAHG